MNRVLANFGNPDNTAVGKLTDVTNLSDIFGIQYNLLFGVGLSLSIIFVIVCGIKFVTSAGDPNKKAEAGQCLTWAVISAIVIVSFKLIPFLIFNIFGFDDPTTIINT